MQEKLDQWINWVEYDELRDEQNYPNWKKVIQGTQIDKNNFNQYVEMKMNDTIFVEDIFGIFEKSR